jgi:hypothetical protein
MDNDKLFENSEASEMLDWVYRRLMKLQKDKKFEKLLEDLQYEDSSLKRRLVKLFPMVQAYNQPPVPFKNWSVQTLLKTIGGVREKYDASIKFQTAAVLYEATFGPEAPVSPPLVSKFIHIANLDLADYTYYINFLASKYRMIEFRDVVIQLLNLIDESVALLKIGGFKDGSYTAGEYFHVETNRIRSRIASELQSAIYENCEKVTNLVSEFFTCPVAAETPYNLGLTPDYDFLQNQKIDQLTKFIHENEEHISILKRFAKTCETSVSFIENQKEHLTLTIEDIDQRLVDLQKEIDITYEQREQLLETKRSFQQQKLTKKQMRRMDQEIEKGKMRTKSKLSPAPTLGPNQNNNPLGGNPSNRPIWSKRHIKPGGAIMLIEENQKPSIKEKISDGNLKLYLILGAGILLTVISLANGNYGFVSGFSNSNLKLMTGITPIIVQDKFNSGFIGSSKQMLESSKLKLSDYLTFKDLIPSDGLKLKDMKEILDLDSEIITDLIQKIRKKCGK